MSRIWEAGRTEALFVMYPVKRSGRPFRLVALYKFIQYKKIFGLGVYMKILFISLGCDKNLSDSEEMLGLLTRGGHEIVDDENIADAIVINTCCFIGDAKEESVNTILEMAELKKTGSLKALIVTGCLAQRYKQEIIEEIPEVDAVLGTTSYADIVKALKTACEGSHYERYRDIDELVEDTGRRVLTTGGHVGYLKIAEGCDKHCTYCIIPSLRGKFRSVPEERLLRQARDMAEQGVKELILVAQETTVYGTDLYGKKTLHLLVKKLCEIPGIRWIRILYCYPEEIYDELIETIRDEKKVCHYLDLPIQHASDKILRRMGRRTTRAELTEIVEKLRREIPDIVLRTTLITGFPGETQEDHEELMAFVDEMEFDRLGVFTYSAEEDTPAAGMPDQIPEELKEERRDEIMELQQEISLDHGNSRIGQELLVMIEGKVSGESAYIGRTYGDAPKVDGYIFIQTGELLVTGDFARVRVTGAMEYDLIGVLADEYAE
jgi:ribosomal protein S12 methylthiotransferase